MAVAGIRAQPQSGNSDHCGDRTGLPAFERQTDRITGSNGKTTTTALVSELLKGAGLRGYAAGI